MYLTNIDTFVNNNIPLLYVMTTYTILTFTFLYISLDMNRFIVHVSPILNNYIHLGKLDVV